jgi:CubicO group peptidase (beta-lactamase class C family)
VFDDLFKEFDRPDAPGLSVVVIRDGRKLWARGYGLANLEEKVPCTPNTNFRLASLTKQFTAMAVLILAGRNKLALTERLPDFFPEFPAWGTKITVHHLLTHTSGLADYETMIPKHTKLPVLDQDVLRLLLQQDKTYFRPGTKYRYSNSGYALLALIVEKRAGHTFPCFLQDNIFTPLRMAGTLAYEQGSSVVPNRAFGYTRRGKGFTRTDQSLTSSVLGDGGIYSSVTDLFKWDQSLYTDRLVSLGMLERAFTPVVRTECAGSGYGFGWFAGNYRRLKELWHYGETVGFTTHIARFPERRLTVILLANRTGAKLATLPHRVVDRVLFG